MLFTKSSHGLLPADQDAQEWFSKLKSGGTVSGKFVVPRNLKFMRKFFAMLRVAYDNYDWPVVDYGSGTTKCSYERFRKDVTILAGYYEIVVNTKGELRKDAMSISFAKMDEAEFSLLYSEVLDVILMQFLQEWESNDMERAVEQMLGFS